MSKVSFRARTLDAAKQMPVFTADELPDLGEYAAINRAVARMPTGMEKDEEMVSSALQYGVPSSAFSRRRQVALFSPPFPAMFKQFYIFVEFPCDLAC